MQPILKKFRLFFLLTLVMQSNSIIGQDSDFIFGKLINSEDNTPVSFAHIIIKNKEKGLISNSDGGFRIPIELQKQRDTLVISSIGYSLKEIPLTNLNKENINLIYLAKQTELLNEIILISHKKKKKEIRDPQEIIRLAIKNIPKNYPFKPFSYVGYYRDYQKKEKEYLNLNEALLQVYDAGFSISDAKETQTRIYQYKKNPKFKTDTIAAKPYDYKNKNKIASNAKLTSSAAGKNEYTLLRIHDAIRNYNVNSYDFVNRLDINFVKNHKFKLLPDTFINNIPLYHISISKTIENFNVKGTIFISKGDFKIYKMQYAVYDKRASLNSNKQQHLRLREDNNLGKLLFKIILEYQSHKGIMYPNYISFNNSFKSLQPPKFFSIDSKISYTKGPQLTFNTFKLTLNKAPLLKDALKKRNYKLWYKDEKLNIDSIKIKQKTVLLYFDKEKIYNTKQTASSSKLVFKNLRIAIKNIRDNYGNLLNQQEYVNYNQYREFFVQELKTNSKKPLDTLYMLKNEPIFKHQAIAPHKNLKNYWMNTPLKH